MSERQPVACHTCGLDIYVFKSKRTQKDYACNSNNYRDFHQFKDWRAPAETPPKKEEKKIDAMPKSRFKKLSGEEEK